MLNPDNKDRPEHRGPPNGPSSIAALMLQLESPMPSLIARSPALAGDARKFAILLDIIGNRDGHW